MKYALIVLALAGGRAFADEPRPHLELPQQSLTDGQNVKLGPMTVPSSRDEREMRPLMIGGGIVVLAAAMWWNRKRREQFDRSDAAADTPSATGSREDEDTDDLQAAARGDDKDKA